MSLSKCITTAAVAVILIAGNMLPLATAANADSWGGHGQAYSYSGNRDWNGGQDRRFRGFEQYRAPRYDYRDYRAERRDDRKDRHLARGVAIGLGVLMLGAILSRAGNHHDRYDY